MTAPFGQTTILGYPRIGPRRELKRALESYWAGHIDADALAATAADIRGTTWQELRDAGLDAIPSNTFSLYDQVLDAAVAVDAIPKRFRRLGLDPLGTYVAMARGTAREPALELTKWFDTNYHYLVPEIGPATAFTAHIPKIISEYAEARALGIDSRPVLIGPATLLLLAKAEPGSPEGFQPFDRLDDLVDVYAEMLGQLADAGVSWVQLDEPGYVADRTPAEIAALTRTYQRLGGLVHRPRLLVASYFGELGDALAALLDSTIDALALDLVTGRGDLDRLIAHPRTRDLVIVAGLIDGRNVWRADLRAAAETAVILTEVAGQVAVSTSCSLLHVPVDLDAEEDLDPALRDRLCFARQKVQEVVALGRALRDGPGVLPLPPGEAPAAWHDPAVRARMTALRPQDAQRGAYPDRVKAQRDRLHLPPLPTTTIGSFPQTDALRAARAEHRAGKLDDAGYADRIGTEITQVIALQERLGLDVLVHGEPERNDMVQYFAEHLTGFASTANGWVQSYGSRCVRPPIIYGDVSRPEPITVAWTGYAQSLTDRPVKGMLTGPVTILAWSFVRDDQPTADTATQVALALRDEVGDLVAAGVPIVQVDEPALRELLPLRHADQKAYLDWAVQAFRVATGGAPDETQIHTHLCYSEFGQVLPAIEALDADVTSIEASRSKMEILDDLRSAGYSRGIGPGVYDIHSPRVPDQEEIVAALRRAVAVVPADRLWVNPDCGLKTRDYPEVERALTNIVSAAATVRAAL